MNRLLLSLILILAQSTVLPKTIVLKGTTIPKLAAGTVTRIQSSQGTNCFGSAGCAAPAFASNLLAGDIIGVCAQWVSTTSTGITLSSISDSQSLTYTVVAATLQVADTTTDYHEIGTECGYSTTTSTAAADTVTCHFSGGQNGNFCSAFELHGAQAGTAALDVTSVGTGSGTAISAGSATTTANGDLGLAICVQDDGIGAGGIAAGSLWTRDQNLGGGDASFATEYQAQSTAGSITGNFSSTFATAWVASMITFK